jgi:hypothetical protein
MSAERVVNFPGLGILAELQIPIDARIDARLRELGLLKAQWVVESNINGSE